MKNNIAIPIHSELNAYLIEVALIICKISTSPHLTNPPMSFRGPYICVLLLLISSPGSPATLVAVTVQWCHTLVSCQMS